MVYYAGRSAFHHTWLILVCPVDNCSLLSWWLLLIMPIVFHQLFLFASSCSSRISWWQCITLLNAHSCKGSDSSQIIHLLIHLFHSSIFSYNIYLLITVLYVCWDEGMDKTEMDLVFRDLTGLTDNYIILFGIMREIKVSEWAQRRNT